MSNTMRELIEAAFREGHELGQSSAEDHKWVGYGNTWWQDWEESDAARATAKGKQTAILIELLGGAE